MRARLEASKRENELRAMSSRRRNQIAIHRGTIEQLQKHRRNVVVTLLKEHEGLQDAFEACGLSSSLAPRPGMRPRVRRDTA